MSQTPYYAVIFTSVLKREDEGYAQAAEDILRLAEQQPGFLGFETARQEIGISVSYWSSLEAIEAWRQHTEHLKVQRQGRDWYASYRVRVCRVERDYAFAAPA